MSTRRSWPHQVLLAAVLLTALYVTLLYVLDAVGLMESLLAPSGLRALLVLPLALGLLAARLLLLFVMPGLVVAALLTLLLQRRARGAHRTPRSTS
ncbi:hypothetical protein [Chondromyces crocatus]|uniref:Uncharacterized protein n=1 Tax=Chondromyces crocatus TaxID=52 RepID=A0A0K1E6Q8_CHOCO|nr:hypothetical protein [Chondromyces crocatus]AKT36377.1 uncharacterized protein CMC5_004900 [Chondromyces crocatus]